MRKVLLPLFLVLTPAAASADDRGYLTALLEDNLSGAGRQVTITGFAGALSSRATIQQLTIADDEGIWITLDDVVLDWSRTALLSGQVIVNELSASAITMERIPTGDPDQTTPEAGTFEFSLPELPVSIDIGEVRADRIVLGAPVLGQPLEGTLSAKVHLAGGEGNASVLIERKDDGPEGRIALEGSYANETGRLVLDLDAREGAGGIVASALDLPGAPPAALTLKGEGTFNDFAAEFRLESDGDERLAGPISVKTAEDGTRGFAARLSGNPAPLFLPEYAEFLGEDLKLDVTGARSPTGTLSLDELLLEARSLNLSGKLRLAPDGLPELLDITASVADPAGGEVLLPTSGPVETRIRRADLVLAFDATQDSGWSARVDLAGLNRPDLTVERAGLRGSGRLDRAAGRRGVGGTLLFDMTGLGGLDPALVTALGERFDGRAVFSWREGAGRLAIPQITLTGADYGLNGGIWIEGLGEALKTRLRLEVDASDLSRFSGLAGRPLGGAAEVGLRGEVSPLTGAFDLVLDVTGQGLTSGIAEADRLLAGRSAITASVLRDTTGTELRSFTASAATLNVTGQGRLQSSGASLTGNIVWASLADLGPNYGGSLNVAGGFDGTLQDGLITLTGQGDGLRIGQAEVDRLIAGRSDIALKLALLDGAPVLRDLNLTSPNLSAEVAGEGDSGAMRVSGRLSDLALLAPDFPGPVTLSGRLTPRGSDFDADLRVTGPAGIDARVNGRIGAVPDLAISGTGEAAVANALTDPVTLGGRLGYDIRLSGGWAPQNATGRVTLSGGQVAVPARGLSLDSVAATADLSGGTARLALTASAARGGGLRLDGPLGLVAPYNADLSLRMERLRLRDPELYDTTLDAVLQLSGPLLGAARLTGRVVLDETELRVPSTGFASAADLEAISHVNDRAEVRATRARAGVGAASGGGTGAAGGLPGWLLDVVIAAPNRVFVRGRGLDAELGGEIRIGGSLNNIIPSGALDLVRGRLDILGKRLVLDEASLVLEGSFIPYITFVATNVTEDVTSIVTIEGPANDPVVTFSSDPELPQEEVLAWLLFGRGLDTISAFQAAQLANAVATLAGRGGEGIVSKLRRGFGVDDLDVNTAADGTTSVSAGKYISDNVYTEFGVDQSGNTRVNLNLDLRPGVTVKGRVDSDGSSGIGLFLERDY
ncbi:translocation/assembly module TamB domain-containing protein [Pseudogemmobacter humi]|uniref:Translocation and assembly module TamB n=1 Tax=Pseudogemmobacter humi TaxID=2483812 RepID=A0A3P5X5N3_9RHOB|nr:translocation/assembly module TamB domain-containing protein [Pseudogemmobacter humi]VDC23519.1 Translocation and assembly module TamB [Pseudogemmobacter humi]